MENAQPQLISIAAYAPVSGENATPFSQQTVVLTKQDSIALKWEANYWRAQHLRLVQREAALQAQVEALEVRYATSTNASTEPRASNPLVPRLWASPIRPIPESGAHNLGLRDTAAVIVPFCQWWLKCMT